MPDHTATGAATDIVLITGANKGLGLETARRLSARGATVLIGSRDPDRGDRARARLVEAGADPAVLHVVEVDVTSDESADKAAARVAADFGRIDVLVNNAGIIGSRVPAGETGPDDFRACYETNVFGPVRMTRAFLPLLRRAPHPRVVMVSSGMGSIAVTTDPDRLESGIVSLVYPSSKAALNMITTQYAKALPTMKVNAVDPGYTATDLNGHSGHQSVEEGAEIIVRLATVGPDGPTGGYFDRDGVVPW